MTPLARKILTLRAVCTATLFASVLAVGACSDDDSAGQSPAPPAPPSPPMPGPPPPEPPLATFAVAGTVSGLRGAGLVLQNNAGDDLAVGRDGIFTFATRIGAGAPYAVSVKTQPGAPPQTCTVNAGSGVMGGADASQVNVTCADNAYRVTGTVSGLAGDRLVLQNNGGDELHISGNGPFSFATPLATGAQYAVTVLRPGIPAQNCAVIEGSGAIGDADVTSVKVSCAARSARFAYVTSPQRSVISQFLVEPATGGLTAVGSPVLPDSYPTRLVVHPNGKFAYATDPVAPGVIAYAVDAGSGALSEVGPRVPTIDAASHIAIHPNGKFAYVSVPGNNAISIYAIDAVTGALTERNGGIAASDPVWISVDTLGRFLYVVLSLEGSVATYAVDPLSGALTGVGVPTPAGTRPVALALEPGGRFAFVIDAVDQNISTFAIDSETGALTAAGLPVAAGQGTYEVTMHPNGRFLYLPNAGDTLTSYAIDAATGALSPVPGSPYAAGSGPRFAAVDPGGNYVYVINHFEGTVWCYAIDPTTGALTSVGGPPTPTGAYPVSMSFVWQ